MKVIRADDQFATSEIKAWCDSCTPQVKILPCIPHEHQQIGKVDVSTKPGLHPKSVRIIAVASSLIHQGGLLLYNPLTNKVVTKCTLKQLGHVDVPSIIFNLYCRL